MHTILGVVRTVHVIRSTYSICTAVGIHTTVSILFIQRIVCIRAIMDNTSVLLLCIQLRRRNPIY